MNSLKVIAVCAGIFMAHNAMAQNVGIGTDTPTEKLHVVGGARIENLSGVGYRLVQANGTGVLSTILDGTAGQVLTTDGAGVLSFQTIGGNHNTLDMAYDEGGAGAGRQIDASDGAVRVNGDDGFIVTGTYGSGDLIEVSGAGTRMFFNPNKAAFRAGRVTTQWDNANIGNYSTAMGMFTTASGQGSTAMGAYASASGYYSTAMGHSPSASGNYSTAMGASTTASGIVSTAMGRVTTAPSYSEMAIGSFNTNYTPASTTGWNTADRLFVVGNGTGLGAESNALIIYKNGTMNINDAYDMPTADGTAGQVMTTDGAGVVSFQTIGGNHNTLDMAYDEGGAGAGRQIDATDGAVRVNGDDGFIVTGTYLSGDLIEVSGAGTRMFFNPHKAAFRAGGVWGNRWDNANIGGYSTAMGLNTTASGGSSTAMGYQTTASGTSSTAIGAYTTASGSRSTAMGSGTTAPSFVETAIGRYNTSYVPASTTGWNTADRLFVVGNGTGTGALESNALIIYKNGTMNINDAYDMPTADGLAGQVMTTNGAGVVSFQTPPDAQDLTLSGNTLSLTNDATTVDLSAFLDNTDNQDLTLTGNTLSLTNDGTSVDLSAYQSNTLDEAYDEGGAGAGRSIDAVDGTVAVNGEDGLVVTGTFGSGLAVGNSVGIPSGAGTRMFFNPNKAAFRAGRVTGTEWDNANIGNYSTAMGINTSASGNRSTAMGSITVASGYVSTAMGANTTASGQISTAMGFATSAPSGYETAIGRYNTNYTPASTTGWNTADRLFVVGNGTGTGALESNALIIYKNGTMNINDAYDMPTADGLAGQVMTTDGAGVVSFQTPGADQSNTLDEAYDEGGAGAGRSIDAVAGTVAVNGEDGLVVTGTHGSGLAVGDAGGIPQGAGTRMFFNPNKAAFRAGRVTGTEWDNANIGNYSTAMGLNTSASGTISTAMGVNTTASGNYSTAMGAYTTASGTYSTAMGNGTTASGTYSTAMGAATTASGTTSTAMGNNTTAPSGSETAIGRYNTSYVPASTTGWNAADRLFVVGNGTGSGAESDAMVILKNGNVGIGTSSPSYKLEIDGGNSPLNITGGGAAFPKMRVDVVAPGDAILRLYDFNTIEDVRLATNGNSWYNGTGNFGIGTTTPVAKLEVAGGNVYSTNGDFYAAVSNGVINAGGGIMTATINYIGDNYALPSNVNGDEDLYIQDDLQVDGAAFKPGGGTWTAASDRRLKTNIVSYEDGLDKLMLVKPVRFNYNKRSGFENLDKQYIGVIAQDLNDVAPYMVEERNFWQQTKEDENGVEQIIEEGEKLFTVDPNAFIYMLINSVQEQQEQIDALKEEIKLLKEERK